MKQAMGQIEAGAGHASLCDSNVSGGLSLVEATLFWRKVEILAPSLIAGRSTVAGLWV